MSGSNNSSNMSFENKFKLKAVDLAKQIGHRAAGKELKIPEASIRRWTKIADKIRARQHNPPGGFQASASYL